MIRWLARYPLAIALAVQAAVQLPALGLLYPWMDEATTLFEARESSSRILAMIGGDVHPPLYFLLVNGWQKIPFGFPEEAQARLLSVLFTLAATVALDRLWANRLAAPERRWVLALWVASPCLLLYARMARSYSLQVLVVLLAAAAIRRFLKEPRWQAGAILAGMLTVGLYVHYVPGIALVATAALALARQRRWRDIAAVNACVLVLYAPWGIHLAGALSRWQSGGANPAALASLPYSMPLKLAFWGMSFVLGETVPDAVLIAGLLVFPLVAAALWNGMRRDRELVWLAAPLTAIGFVGVARWVSYPFLPARLLFLLPFFVMLVVRGAARKAMLWVMLTLSFSGIWNYYHLTGFRNKQYPFPMRDVAALIRRTSAPFDSAILVDDANSDEVGLQFSLGPGWTVLRTTAPGVSAKIDEALENRSVRTFWFLRNTHDVTGTGINARLAARIAETMTVAVHPYEPFSRLELMFLRASAIKDPPAYFHELLEFRR